MMNALRPKRYRGASFDGTVPFCSARSPARASRRCQVKLTDITLQRGSKTSLELSKSTWLVTALSPCSGAQTAALFSREWREDGIGPAVFDTFNVVTDHSRPCTDRFFGYVFGSGEPVGAASELLIAALNQNTTSWRSAPAAATIEQVVIGWLACAIGCSGFRGTLCGGGSTANLMGLAMAREAKLPANHVGVRPCVVYCSAEAHFSIAKTVALLGIGKDNLRLIAVDKSMRMHPGTLRLAIAEDRQAGRLPIAVVATAGTVVSGAIDPFKEIAAIASDENLWLHIDGAYGALAAMAVPELFEGLRFADSVSLDAHKWLYQTADCGCLLYRDPGAARTAFSQNADYVRVMTEDPVEAFMFFAESVELTRRFRALKLWMSLQYHGRRAFQQSIWRDLPTCARSSPRLKTADVEGDRYDRDTDRGDGNAIHRLP